MARISKALLRDLEALERSLRIGLVPLNDCQGIAHPVEPERALGSDYDIRNVNCVEHCANHSQHIRVHQIVGSNAARLYTAHDIVKKILAEANQPKKAGA